MDKLWENLGAILPLFLFLVFSWLFGSKLSQKMKQQQPPQKPDVRQAPQQPAAIQPAQYDVEGDIQPVQYGVEAQNQYQGIMDILGQGSAKGDKSHSIPAPTGPGAMQKLVGPSKITPEPIKPRWWGS
jgi:hypothetical protein